MSGVAQGGPVGHGAQGDQRALELRALAALGIAPGALAPGGTAPGGVGAGGIGAGGEGLLEALVRAGALARHQALAAQAWITRHAAPCACGARWVKGEPCPACGALLASTPQGAPPRPLGESPRGPGHAPQRGSSSGRLSASGRLALAPGVRVGSLELLEELGRGATAVVYRARHVELQRECALKVVSGATREERRRRRFANEVQALARLVHPGIVKVHAVHELEGGLALEMELVRGQNLEERVRQGGPLPWREAAALVAQLARAVEHAHRLEVLHRDLKPENVLLRAEDGSGVVADFGLSRLSDQASSLTVAGALLGTPLYMAPEAFQGEFTARTDVYGLGALLYQAVSGRAPFQADSAASLQYAVTTGQVAPLRGPGLPPELEAIRARAMAVDPQARYASAEALAVDLERLLRGERTSVSRAGWTGLGARRRVRVALVLALGGCGALAAGLLLRARPPVSAAPPAGREAPPAVGVAGALATLGDPQAPPRRRESALLRLRAACAPGHPEHQELLAGLEPALAAARDPVGLRWVRALLERARRRPVRADDLLAAAPALDAADAEGLALHAIELGCAPPFDSPEALAAARALATAQRQAPAVRALLGVCLCAAGDPQARLEAASALLDPPPPPGAARAVLLSRALREADVLAEELETGGEPDQDGQRLAGLIEAVQRDPQLSRAPAVVLARVVRAVPHGLLGGRLVDFTRPLLAEAVTRALLAGRPALPPAARALEALVRDVLDDDPVWWVRPRGAELRGWAEALTREQPLLGLMVLQQALRYEVEREGPHDRHGALRLLEQEELVEARLLAIRPARDVGTEAVLWARTLHRSLGDRVTLQQRLLALAGDEPTRQDLLLRSLGYARAALEITDRYTLSWREASDLQLVVRLGFQTGLLEEVERVAHRGKESPAVQAELLRRRGRAAEARARCQALLQDPSLAAHLRSDLLAVEALALADLGQLDEARATLARLQEALRGADLDLLLDEWAPAAVEARLR